MVTVSNCCLHAEVTSYKQVVADEKKYVTFLLPVPVIEHFQKIADRVGGKEKWLVATAAILEFGSKSQELQDFLIRQAKQADGPGGSFASLIGTETTAPPDPANIRPRAKAVEPDDGFDSAQAEKRLHEGGVAGKIRPEPKGKPYIADAAKPHPDHKPGRGLSIEEAERRAKGKGKK